MPVNVITKPTTVVDTPEVRIDEFVGNASSGGPAISVARVVSKGKWAEDWQTPEFEEWVLVLKGTVHIEHAGGVAVGNAGEFLHLTKGERVRWVFPYAEGAEYVPICVPGFSLDNVKREEGSGEPLSETLITKHPALYHLIQKELWEKAKATGTTYYPPTYEQDGFTHATANPQFLVDVANHFYTKVGTDWLCLKMTVDSLRTAGGVKTVFEAPAPVGTTPALDTNDYDGELFPHIHGGIPAKEGVVLAEYKVNRAEDGTFLGIEGLC